MKILGIEKVSLVELISVFLVSLLLIFISIAINHYIIEYNTFYRSISEELIRFSVVAFIAMRSGAVLSAALTFSIAELFLSIFLNYSIFGVSEFGYKIAFDLTFSAILMLYGLIAGIIYRKSYLSGEKIAWCLLTLIPLKAAIYFSSNKIHEYFQSNYQKIFLFLGIIFILLIYSYFILRQVSQKYIAEDREVL